MMLRSINKLSDDTAQIQGEIAIMKDDFSVPLDIKIDKKVEGRQKTYTQINNTRHDRGL